MCSKLKFAAFVFFALGLVAMTIAPPLDTCSMKVSKIWVASLGRWVLNPLCGGLCPSQEYTCAAYSYGVTVLATAPGKRGDQPFRPSSAVRG